MTDLDELEKLAMAATRGEWVTLPESSSVYDQKDDGLVVARCPANSVSSLKGFREMDHNEAEANAAFIAAANPVRVISIIAEVKRLRAIVDKWDDEMNGRTQA